VGRPIDGSDSTLWLSQRVNQPAIVSANAMSV
jgi:hypothetical protein